MRSWPFVAVVGLTAGLVGPRLGAPASRTATEPFAYTPPEGFVERSAAAASVDAPGARAWELPGEAGEKARAVVVAHHSTMDMQVDEPALRQMVSEMPRAFEECAWVHRRHEMRVRPDDARVGLIEGDCDGTRKLQLVFPENQGTAIVTVSYPSREAARLEPAFEATIDRASGVAVRVPSPPLWQHLAWGLAGAVLGALAAALVRRRDTEKKP